VTADNSRTHASYADKPMEPSKYLPILKRVGWVLIGVGLLDIGVMAYCIVGGTSYSSSFNVFAVLAGVFLLRGSLRTAALVRWFAAFELTALSALVFAWPFIVPLDLSLTLARLHPFASFLGFAGATFILGLLSWAIRELGREPVQEAIASQHVRQCNVRAAALLGLGLVVILGVVMTSVRNSEAARRAISIAESAAGPGYRFCVTSLNVRTGARGTVVSGAVAAWKDTEIKTIPIHWQEP